MKNMCIFATAKSFYYWGNESCPRVAFRAFFMPEKHNIRRSSRAYITMVYASPSNRTFSSGSWTPFFLSKC